MYRFLALIALAFAASPAAAWWEYGHNSVATIAAMEVKPQTRAAIRGLIAHAPKLDTPTCPIRDMNDLSVWPDCIKRLGERFSYADSWHYQNVDVCKPFDQKAACRDGNCVSAQIERNVKLLADKAVPARERLMALSFLVHFVGDLHMPLHAGDRGDLGGNRFGANYGVIGGRLNLHSIWDGLLAERGISTPPGGAAGILGALGMEERARLAGGSVEDWARESWEASRTFAYGGVLDDPCAEVPTVRPTIDEATTQRLIPIVRHQIAAGGLRLARLLDEALAA
ncbi:MAG: S1/P1 nuclease [Allosphingosinicella sp.]